MTRQLHLEILGSGPPLVLLHGWGWHSGVWKPLIPELTKHFQLFMIDLPGSGKSPDLTSNYKIEEIAEKLLEITPKKAIWLGWSLGGMIAWWIAIHYPEKITRLITVCSSPHFVQSENWPGVAPATLDKFSERITQDYEQTLSDFLELQLRGSNASEELFLELKKILFATNKPSMKALLGGLELLRTLDLRAELQQQTTPSLHIFGSHDTLVPVRAAKLLQPTHQVEIITRAGHMPFLTQKNKFLELIL